MERKKEKGIRKKIENLPSNWQKMKLSNKI